GRGEPVGSKSAFPNVRPGEPLTRGWVRVPDAAPPFKERMPVLIAQHPDGQPLKLAADTDAVDRKAGLWVNANGTRIRYATTTEGGPSGSPCFDFDWNLIALHHYGDPAQHHPAGWNQGVPIGMVRSRLQRIGKADALGGDVS